LYWYQSHGKVIASEFAGKFWLVLDAIRYRRSDTALVRVTVPVRGRSEDAALQNATAFVQTIFPSIQRHLPR
jgi:EpsI family protein